jgi:hypothetical protein
MNSIQKIMHVLWLFFFLTGCVNTRAALPTPVVVSTPTELMVPSLAPTPSLSPTSFPSLIPQVKPIPEKTLYQLDAAFHVAEKTLDVDESIQYLNSTGQILKEIVLVVPPNRLEGQFILKSVTLADENTPPEIILLDEQLTIFLPVPLQPGEVLNLNLVYQLILPPSSGVFGYTDRQINVCDWYAFVPPYQQPDGWRINPYHPVGEYLIYDMADFEVNITLDSPDSGLVIAASASGETDGQHWNYQLADARTFVWSASTEYQILTQAENPEIILYVLPEHVDAGWAALSATISAMNIYSATYGEYPHETLSYVEGDFPDGMEYDGLFFVGQEYFQSYTGDEKNYLTAISVHEAAHQWWFAAVGNDAALEPWLDESLAAYSELLFYETYYPGDESWWWNFRVESFNPTGWVNSTVYEYSTYRPYINAIYLRGIQFIQELRLQMGEEAFWSFLKAYYQAGRGQIMSAEDFFNLLAQYTNVDLSTIRASYFR